MRIANTSETIYGAQNRIIDFGRTIFRLQTDESTGALPNPDVLTSIVCKFLPNSSNLLSDITYLRLPFLLLGMSRSMLKFPGRRAILPQIIDRGSRHGKDTTMKTANASPAAPAGAEHPRASESGLGRCPRQLREVLPDLRDRGHAWDEGRGRRRTDG